MLLGDASSKALVALLNHPAAPEGETRACRALDWLPMLLMIPQMPVLHGRMTARQEPFNAGDAHRYRVFKKHEHRLCRFIKNKINRVSPTIASTFGSLKLCAFLPQTRTTYLRIRESKSF
jgi:hypothetical protein